MSQYDKYIWIVINNNISSWIIIIQDFGDNSYELKFFYANPIPIIQTYNVYKGTGNFWI